MTRFSIACSLLVSLAPVFVSAEELRTAPLRQAAPADWTAPEGPPSAVTPAPLAEAYCQILVEGVARDTEMDYLPHVIQCENGGANLQALKAQAIAARSVAYYAMSENGGICDGQGCQVYGCGSNPLPVHYQAVMETAGQYLSFNNTEKGRVLTYAFFVAGDSNQNANCKASNPNANTEQYVTYNEGKTWTGVEETSLGFKYQTPANYGYGQNRGCLGQWSSRCLENNKGYNHEQIIRYFYGADIEIQTAPGPCVGEPDFAATYAGQSFPLASAPPVILTVGDTLEAWIDLNNVGDQTWTANTKLAPTPRDVDSPLAHGLWLSPTRISGPDADTPPDAVGRFSFQISANAPGDYYQTFGLVEEGVTWFSDPAPLGGGPPDDQLEIHVVVVAGPPAPTTAAGEETGGVDETGGTEESGGGSNEGTGGGADGSEDSGGITETPTSGGSSVSGIVTLPGSETVGMDEDDAGCGCAATGSRSLPVWLLAPLLVRRRRSAKR